MTARRPPASGQCKNPLCALMMYPDNPDTLELVQRQPDPDRPGATHETRWHLCGMGCTVTFLRLCQLRHDAQAHPEKSEAEA